MNKTSIEWTHRPGTDGMTWNPVRARLKGQGQKVHSGTFCTRISPGCTNCYASAINKRFGNGLEYTVPNLENVEFFLSEKILAEPLKLKKPATIFVGDMFDLFHEAIPPAFVGRIFGMMAKCQQHTFQLLTKRAQYMHDLLLRVQPLLAQDVPQLHLPMPHVWLGVSVESQKYADERIPLLLQTPAEVRFLSVEPQLEAIDLRLLCDCGHRHKEQCRAMRRDEHGSFPCLCPAPFNQRAGDISWVICGGESGPHARPFNLAWAESLREQCKQAGVAFFMKQVGSVPIRYVHSQYEGLIETLKLADRKGGDPAEWPESLMVREFPA